MVSMRSLGPAARGYEYQDLYSACVLVDLALGTLVDVVVDRKLTPDDQFDDLTTIASGSARTRAQIKHTVEDRILSASVLTTEERSLRLDRLLAAARADRDGPGAGAAETTYRVILRDGPPTESVLTAVLRSADPDPGPLVPEAVSERFQSTQKRCGRACTSPRVVHAEPGTRTASSATATTRIGTAPTSSGSVNTSSWRSVLRRCRVTSCSLGHSNGFC